MRQKLFVVLAVVALVVTAGCTIPGRTPGPEKTSVYVSSHGDTVDDFRQLRVSVTKVGVYQAENDTWTTKTTTTFVDLTNVRGDNATFVASMDLPPDEYSKVYVQLDYVGGELDDGSEPSVELQAKKLTVAKDVTLDGVNTTSYVVDFRIIPDVDGSYLITTNHATSGPDQPFNTSTA